MVVVKGPITLPDKAFPTSQALAQLLPAEAVLDALKMMLIGASLNEILTSIARLIEAHREGMMCSIFLLDEDGLHLRYGVAADVTEAYRAATDGVCIGPNVGSCGAAAYLRQPVFIYDMLSHPNWEGFKDLFWRVDCAPPGRRPLCRRMAPCWVRFACTIAKSAIRL